MDDKQLIKELSATVLGAGAVLGFSTMNIPLALSGVAGIGIYFGVKLLTSTTSKVKIRFDNLPQDTKKRIADLEKVLENISSKIGFLKNANLASEVREIVDLGYKLIEVLSDEANASTLLKDVLKVYSNLEGMLAKLIDLQKHTSAINKEQAELLESFEKLLTKIKKSLQNYYQKGIKSDLQDFEVDMKLMDSKIENID